MPEQRHSESELKIPLSDMKGWMKVLKEAGGTPQQMSEAFSRSVASHILSFKREGLDENACYGRIVAELEKDKQGSMGAGTLGIIKRLIDESFKKSKQSEDGAQQSDIFEEGLNFGRDMIAKEKERLGRDLTLEEIRQLYLKTIGSLFKTPEE